MTSSEFVTGKIDWIKIRLQVEPEMIIEELLGLDINDCSFADGNLIYYNYNSYYAYGLIHVYTYKEATYIADCVLQMSGEACTQFLIMLENRSSSWSEFFKLIFTKYEHTEILRLDVALDDKNKKPYFLIKQLIYKAKNSLYWSNGREYTIHESKYKLTTGKTLNVGARTSNMMIRIYDKAIEQAKSSGTDISDYGSWNRVELELKKEPANDMARLIAHEDESLENIIRGVLREELRFYTDETKINVPKFWDRFLLKVPPIKLNRKYKVTTMESTAKWLEEQGPLAAYQAMEFLTKNGALGDLNDITGKYLEYSRGLAERMIAHLVGIGREDLIPDVQARTKKETREGN
ncbi:replication initiation factor domain-containing protein [Carnobacterium pleistocenium]|uniref:replication initiation factor domain-containing protein n=1 Tax=Carnobacterium pleistocenium TaxID=181073 RepID=UPI00055832E1|nr:replication initiation factor domain-containing protein [Carnobacterium pleistocenium]